MHNIFRSEQRGKVNLGWLQGRHSFSFGDYHDRNRMSFRHLRVLNDDLIAGGGGFPTHPHRDMEIISYMIAGGLTHQDSLGSQETVTPGELQIMSAGSGVTHSEFNASKTETAHLLQIWIFPEEKGLEPTYQQDRYDIEGAKAGFVYAAGPDANLKLRADAGIHIAHPSAGSQIEFQPKEGRFTYLHIATGEVLVNGETLRAGDAYETDSADLLTISAIQDSQILAFDLK